MPLVHNQQNKVKSARPLLPLRINLWELVTYSTNVQCFHWTSFINHGIVGKSIYNMKSLRMAMSSEQKLAGDSGKSTKGPELLWQRTGRTLEWWTSSRYQLFGCSCCFNISYLKTINMLNKKHFAREWILQKFFFLMNIIKATSKTPSL